MPANYVLLATQTVGNGGASTVTFANIPQSGYTDLKIIISGRNGQSAYSDGFSLYVNGGTSYSTIELYNQNASANSYGPRTGSSYLFCGHLPGNSSTANTFGSHEITIPNYTSTGVKSVSIEGTAENNGSQVYQVLYAGLITNGASISSITLDSLTYTFQAGSTFYLYGTAAVGTTPVIAPFASGGDVIANDGTYWYHAFKTTGAFVPAKAISADILVVAGGGGSPAAGTGAGPSGGGGAGGILAFSGQALSATSYTCQVGAGGSSTTGTDSQFGALTLVKGGGIGGTTDNIGGTGGSGGGSGGRYTSAGGAATSGQGNTGGVGYQQSGLASGAGGGAGAVGGAAGNNTGGTGGAGTNTYSSWTTATATGVSNYLAGGGGGMSWYSGSGGAGGAGGGGTGASTSTGSATAGTANTGSGGGGSSYGSNGGSGIIIIRYAMV